MRIGILTLPLHTNYGGILQAYALQTVLERMGYDVKVINRDRTPQRVGFLDNVFINIYNFLSCLRQKKLYIFCDQNKVNEQSLHSLVYKTKFTQKFIDSHIHNYYVNKHESDISAVDFDAIVVGSDQIWSPLHGGAISGKVSNAFLPFIREKKLIKFSYAASFGKDFWQYSRRETNRAKNAIRDFKGVSVREVSGIYLCKKYLNVTAEQHLDPTMLLTCNTYLENLKIKEVEKSLGNMLVYILDTTPEKKQIVDYVEQKLSLKQYKVNSKAEDNTAININMNDCIQPPVEKWLRGFYDADFVVTDSFHACVFSILFKKPFIAIGNKERGLTRFDSLLSKFGLQERLIQTILDLEKVNITEPVDYSYSYIILEQERKKALAYIKSCLKK